MSVDEIYKSEDYKIELKYEGREGHVFYVEESRLPFFWEIIGREEKSGRGLTIPTPREWDSYCKKNGANWAKGRRDEIVQRVAKILAEKWGDGTYEIEQDRWLNIWHSPSLIERLLIKLLGLK